MEQYEYNNSLQGGLKEEDLLNILNVLEIPVEILKKIKYEEVLYVIEVLAKKEIENYSKNRTSLLNDYLNEERGFAFIATFEESEVNPYYRAYLSKLEEEKDLKEKLRILNVILRESKAIKKQAVSIKQCKVKNEELKVLRGKGGKIIIRCLLNKSSKIIIDARLSDLLAMVLSSRIMLLREDIEDKSLKEIKITLDIFMHDLRKSIKHSVMDKLKEFLKDE